MSRLSVDSRSKREPAAIDNLSARSRANLPVVDATVGSVDVKRSQW
jgi:hypothetical protein